MKTSKDIPAADPVPVYDQAQSFFVKKGVDYTWTDAWTLSQQCTSDPNDNKLVFNFPKLSKPHYYFLQDAKLRMSVMLIDKDGNPPNDDFEVYPINNFGMSMWRDLNLYLNDVQISSGVNGLYPYYSYLYHLLTFNSDKKSVLRYKDIMRKMKPTGTILAQKI